MNTLIRSVFNALIVFAFETGGGFMVGNGMANRSLSRIGIGFLLAMLGFGLHMRRIYADKPQGESPAVPYAPIPKPGAPTPGPLSNVPPSAKK